MADLTKRYETSARAIESLRIALEKIEGSQCCESDEEYRTFRDSEIKRFEISLDTLWKYLKHYLEKKTGVVQNSPKSVFRECLKAGIVDDQEVTLALKMVDARNMTSHIYKEEIAEEISTHIPAYYELMKKFIDRAVI